MHEIERLKRMVSQRKSYEEVTMKQRMKHLKHTIEFDPPHEFFHLFDVYLVVVFCHAQSTSRRDFRPEG